MIEKKTVVDQVEVNRTNFVQVRFAILLLEDGREIDKKWHRTSIEPGGDVDAQIAAVNVHLEQMGKALVDPGGIERIRAVVGAAHTPEMVSAFRSTKSA